MLINKDMSGYIESPIYPNENWTEDDESYYLVDSNSEMANIVRDNFPKIDIIINEDGEIESIIPSSPTLEEVLDKKILELDIDCQKTIFYGLDITLSGGEPEHFTLTERDQLNLSGIALKLLMGAETVAWHEDDETVPCRFYSRDDALLIIGTLTTYKEYHITYFRDLRIYVNSLSSIEEIDIIKYGFSLPEEAKSDVLKSYEIQLGGL